MPVRANRLAQRLLGWWQPARDEIARLEALGEAAYDAMYDAQGHRVKELHEDAGLYLNEAGKLAREKGLVRIAKRLEARKEHIRQVYNHQFQYIG